jgi:hypothetical protein
LTDTPSRSELARNLAEALHRLRLAFPGYADSHYAIAFTAIEMTQADLEQDEETLQPIRIGLDSIRGLFPGNIAFQKTFQEADTLLNALLKKKIT